MTVIELPDEQAALRAQAKAQGLTLEAWLEKIAADAPAPGGNVVGSSCLIAVGLLAVVPIVRWFI